MPKLSEFVERKFVDNIDVDGWEIETDTGWSPLTAINKTIPYEKWALNTEHNILEGADTHIVFDENMNEVFIKDLEIGNLIQTKFGLEKVKAITNTAQSENMFDVTVNDDNHRFYSNNILSHNTVTAAGYLLWSAMFKSDQTILIAAHKFSGASEIMSRIRFGYESVPDFIRAGITEYNKQSIVFDNGSRIIAQTTTETTGRGMSISILYSDEMSSVRPTIAREFWTSCSLTLSTGGKAIVTSTPNNSDDLFADIWHNANKTEDEYGNTIPNGLGVNGFRAITALWNEHPDRDELWAHEQRELVGDERFAREILCLSGDTKVDIRFPDGSIKKMSILELQAVLSS